MLQMCYHNLVKPETREWVDQAEQELAAASVLVERLLLPQAVFHTHLAVEKTLKALWTETQDSGLPPRTHDLMALQNELGLELSEWHMYLGWLSEQAVASRYANPSTYTVSEVEDSLVKAKELCALLRQRLT